MKKQDQPVEAVPLEKEWAESSNVKQAKYIVGENKLEVVFRNGSTYHYEQVPAEVWAEMVAAQSVGSFLSANLKGKYRASRFN